MEQVHMTIGEMLQWATDERQIAEAAKEVRAELADQLTPDQRLKLDYQIALQYRRAAWLDAVILGKLEAVEEAARG